MILLAVENNGYVYAYNENKKKIICKRGKLYSFNEKFVYVKELNSDVIEIINDKGVTVYKYPYDILDTTNITGIIV